MWYVYEDNTAGGPIPLSADRVKEIVELNEAKKFPEDLKAFAEVEVQKEETYTNVVGQDSLTRFDSKTKSRRKKRRKPKGGASKQQPTQGKRTSSKQKGGQPKGQNNPKGSGGSNRPPRGNRRKNKGKK